MKTKRLAIIFLIFALCFSCRICPPSAVEPQIPRLLFSIMDEEGNDLFFGDNSIYDPYTVKITSASGESWYIDVIVEKCFILRFSQNKTSTFNVVFVPNRIDTIKIESRKMGFYVEHANCPPVFDIYSNNVFFNDSLVCTDCCDREIYKLLLK